MKILALPKAVSSSSANAFDPQLVNAEVDAVLRLYQAGVIRDIYTRANSRGIVFTLEASSPEEAKKVLDDLPAVQRGVIEIELFPLAPFLGFLRPIQEEATHPH